MRNFARINNYYNRIEAWKAWRKLAEQATAAGFEEQVNKLHPHIKAGWRKIDKCTAALRDHCKSQGVELKEAA